MGNICVRNDMHELIPNLNNLWQPITYVDLLLGSLTRDGVRNETNFSEAEQKRWRLASLIIRRGSMQLA